MTVKLESLYTVSPACIENFMKKVMGWY